MIKDNCAERSEEMSGEKVSVNFWQSAECHAHMVLDGVDFRTALARHEQAPEENFIRETLAAYRKAGITYVRDGGDNAGASVRARELAAEYGIEYRTPIFAIHKNGFYGKIVGKCFDTLKEYRQLIDEVKQSDGDFVKVMLGGILDFAVYPQITGGGLTADWMREMVHIAHEEGFAVMAHVNGEEAICAALEAGIDSLEHGFLQTERSLQLLAETGAVWVPTLAPVMNQLGDGRFPDEVLRAYGESQMRNIRRAMELGVKLAVGSDAGAYRVLHASGFQDELGWMQQAMCGEDESGRVKGSDDAADSMIVNLAVSDEMRQRLDQGAREITERFRRV